MISIEYILAGAAILLLFSIVASKASDRLGIPALLIFREKITLTRFINNTLMT
ncbi:MAG: hypothetical protein N2257_00885 [Thermodesulfovibrionales bacterium]|nr:hypothetical protein [Thermodesulfovibrionales bacterium]